MAEHEHHPHERWERFEEAAIAAEMETGEREETVEEAKRGVVRRFARLIGGFFLVALGTAMLVLPGPGLVTIAAGLFLLSRDIPFAARLLERVREPDPRRRRRQRVQAGALRGSRRDGDGRRRQHLVDVPALSDAQGTRSAQASSSAASPKTSSPASSTD